MTDDYIPSTDAVRSAAVDADSWLTGGFAAFDRWLAAYLEEIAAAIEDCIDWSDGRNGYGDNDGYAQAARIVREWGKP